MADTTLHKLASHLAGEDELRAVIAFFALYRTARIMDAHNASFLAKLDDFRERLSGVTDADTVAIKVHNGHYFLNDKMVRLSDDTLASAETIVKEWTMLGIGGIRFGASVGQNELGKFMCEIAADRPAEDTREQISQKLKELGIDGIDLLGLREEATDLDEIEKTEEQVRQKFRAMARTTFFTAMSTARDVMSAATDDQDINVAKTKRVIHSLIDRIVEDESSLIELTAIKNFDDYTYAHSTNVCVYSLTLGVRLEMDRARLSQLGFAALFHDMGKVKLPRDLIHKPEAFDEDDWIQMQRHPLLGAKTILRNLDLSMHIARAARGAFEHHINNDFTGYPALRYRRRPTNLFSRIISIADTFDALTSGRVYIKRNLPPDEVIKKMRYQMTAKFDPLLLKLFTNIVGIYPAGSLVLLSTDELALVLTHNDSDRTRPFIKIVGDRGGLLERPQWVDLSQDSQENRRIVRMVEPEQYGLDIQEFVLQD